MFLRKELERNILEEALKAFEIESGLRLYLEQIEANQESSDIKTVLRLNEGNHRFAAEVKRWAQQMNTGALVHHFSNLPFRGILVADYVNPKMATRLRQEDVQFIDTVGNAYLNARPVYVFVSGKRKPKESSDTKERVNRAFDRTGLKVVFAFLCQPNLVKATYREIAQTAGVALGTVGWVLNGLTASGVLLDKGRVQGRQIVDYQHMLDRWVEAYPEKLRPKLLVGNFLPEEPYWWRDLVIQNFGGVWGGETAAALYTDYLTPMMASAYLPKGTYQDFLTQARLRKASEWQETEPGTVRLYNMFWNERGAFTDLQWERGLAPPVLVYADLVATGDSRNRETAKMIYDEYLAQYCR